MSTWPPGGAEADPPLREAKGVMRPDELIATHVELFNRGVRSGDWAPMLEAWADDAELAFEGVPEGPFVGKDAIAQAYRSQPPDDELEVLAVSARGDTIVAPYKWRRDAGPRSGDMIFTLREGKIARLVVTFDSPAGA